MLLHKSQYLNDFTLENAVSSLANYDYSEDGYKEQFKVLISQVLSKDKT